MSKSGIQNFENIRQLIRDLVSKYNKLLAAKGEKGLKELSEANVRKDYVDLLFEALGWSVRNSNEYDAENYVRGVGLADVAIKVNEKIRLFVEAKRFGGILPRTERGVQTTLSGYKVWADWTTEERQVLNYAGMSLDSKWAILTNFEKFRLFNAKTGDIIINIEKPDEYLDRLDDLIYLTKRNVESGAINKLESRIERKDVDLNFLNSMNYWRLKLASEIFKTMPDLGLATTRRVVQRILDRLVVIRFAEDKWILDDPDQLKAAYEFWTRTKTYTKLTEILKTLFEGFNTIHDSRIFEKDELVNKVIDQINPSMIGEMIDQLYNQSFRKFTSNILGATYESYLSHELVIREEPIAKTKYLDLIPNEIVRKSGGIYYTPNYVVSFIVDRTIGISLEQLLKESIQLLNEQKYDEAKRQIEQMFSLRVLDNACGSGSFLIKTVEAFKQTCEFYNDSVQSILESIVTESNKLRREGGHKKAWELTSNPPQLLMDYDLSVLHNCIFGVDVDAAAAEIAAVNLVLQSLKKGEKLPLILHENIKVGNSLVWADSEMLAKHFSEPLSKLPFNWNSEFNEVISNGGFDAVIGNPPYVTMESFPEEQGLFQAIYPEVYTGKSDILYYFIYKGITLIKQDRKLGYIVSRYFIEAKYANKLRQFLLDNAAVETIVDFGNIQIFENVNVLTTIMILRKEKDEKVRKSNQIKCIRVWKWNRHNSELLKHIEQHISSKDYQDEYIEIFPFDQQRLSDKPWNFTSTLPSEIKGKMSSISSTLGELCEIEQSQKTGLNKAFIVDEQKIAKWNLEKSLLRRVLSNSEVKKYYVDWDGNYLIYTTDSTEIDKYPGIKKYLREFKDELDSRSESKDGLYPWWRLQRPRREDLFSAPEKIIVPFLSTENRFAYDDREDGKGYYGTTDTYVLVPFESCKYDIMYILALLNSKCVEFYHKNSAKLKRDEYYEYSRTPLMKIPIAKIDTNSPHYKEVIKDTRDLFNKKKTYYRSIHTFETLIQNYSDSSTETYPLKEFVSRLSGDYTVDLAESKKLLADSVTGKVTGISIKQEGNFLILSATYYTDVEKTEPIMHIAMTDKQLLDFFYYSIKLYLMINYRRSNWGTGRIIDIILKSIEINNFSHNVESNKKRIKSLMKEFYDASLIMKNNLSEIETQIQLIQDRLDELAYKCYKLPPEHIEAIKQFIQRQASQVSRTF